MIIQLTPQQQNEVDQQPNQFVQVIDPRTNATFFLVPAEEYEKVREIIEGEQRRSVIHGIALRNAVGRMARRDQGNRLCH